MGPTKVIDGTFLGPPSFPWNTTFLPHSRIQEEAVHTRSLPLILQHLLDTLYEPPHAIERS